MAVTVPNLADGRDIERATPALVARLRGAPASAKAILLALLAIREGGLNVRLPDGRTLAFGDPAARGADLAVKDYRFARRVLANGDIGFAEGLMAGEWESADLSALLTLLAGNAERIMGLVEGGWLGKIVNGLRHLSRVNTKRGSRRNILAHYDLGNRFYEAWLDGTMTYSAARFDAKVRDLETAQLEKYRALARHLDLKPGDHVLEIGCGWGGLAEVAANEFGARVTGLTISDAQYAYACERMRRVGLADRVEIRRQDYRDVEGSFDKVASIEMFEAVGERYWPAYFSKIADVLKPGGRAALQIITIRANYSTNTVAALISFNATCFPAACWRALSACSRRRPAPAWCGEKPRRSAKATPTPWRNGRAGSAPNGRRFARWASTSGSSNCGASISAIAKQVSAPGAPTWCNWRWQNRPVEAMASGV